MTIAAEQMPQGAIAPWRHTLILCAILLAIAAAGFTASHLGSTDVSSGGAPARGQPTGLFLYPMLLLAEYALFRVVQRGIARNGLRILDLISQRALGLRALAIDVVLGIGLFCTCAVALSVLHGSSSKAPAAVQQLIVHDPIEIPLWIMVSLAAGFVEELTFRGYLQRQFASKVGSLGGIAIQALLFGVAHGYQGVGPLIGITMIGLIFGVAAWGRRSLVPVIIAHVAIDIVGGLQLLR